LIEESTALLQLLSSRGASRALVRRVIREVWLGGGSTDEALARVRRDYGLECPSARAVEGDRAAIDRLGLEIVDVRSPRYPPLLREIPDPPAALFVQGDPSSLTPPLCVAVVGSRRATACGKAFATALAADLARAKITVVSGLALGVDGAAHAGALEELGTTVAVMGGGHANVYPRIHRALATRVVANGALISEYAPLNRARPEQFPERNRIISGLCAAVVVVEATRRSGSLITARLALEQGREVMAVPGAVEGGAHGGCHRLIRQGAQLVEGVADVLEALGLAKPETPAIREPTDPLHRRVLSALSGSEIPLHDIVESLGMTVEVVLTALVELELEGFVTPHRGGYIRRPLTTADT